ncbi:hypothetical protein BASA50_003967 [Batrachochytrium salamandrivorans]|uniref:mannan endo-1,6-alpha-mannosidase n=1 Tax=Batrachochytrium salamandrivorans TaxID=1357716 RepID=A0ABQ8FGU7_9FUNG|nr:hypothetical protein BASA62_005925 [Batrachochytrium salamandrivorans]KAH6598085.1 hypothetical protein BASA50_003967 [Batrachochytrium salamandrivorans]
MDNVFTSHTKTFYYHLHIIPFCCFQPTTIIPPTYLPLSSHFTSTALQVLIFHHRSVFGSVLPVIPTKISISAINTTNAESQSLDINNSDAVRLALSSAVHTLLRNHPPNIFGSFGTPEYALWGESALIWNSVIGYLGTANDVPVLDVLRKSLNIASFQGIGDFLGGDLAPLELLLHAKTNDKLVPWGLAVARGALVFGSLTQIDPAGLTFGNLTVRTWERLHSFWDDTVCGGGIPTDPSVPLRSQTKTAATNAGFMALSAQLYGMTGNTTYRVWADKTYNWMVTSGLLTSTFSVHESLGVQWPNSSLSGNSTVNGTHAILCEVDSLAQWSIAPGMLLSALGYLYQFTSLDPYLGQLRSLLKTSLGKFSTSEGVIVEALCELGAHCGLQGWFKGAFVMGLTDTFQTITAVDVRKQIAGPIATSLANMVHTCDMAWNCSHIWAVFSGFIGGPTTSSLLNDEYQAIQILGATMVILQVTNGTGFNTVTHTSPTDININLQTTVISQLSSITTQSVHLSTEQASASPLATSIPILVGDGESTSSSARGILKNRSVLVLPLNVFLLWALGSLIFSW